MEDQLWKKVSIDDIDFVAHEIEELLERPAIVILDGEMGAGKTTFIHHFTQKVIHDLPTDMVSPTYSIINQQGPIVHADFYRLESPEELINLELDLYLDDHTSFFFVEWGKEYLRFMKEIIDFGCSYYLLEITVENSLRNYCLKKIEN